MIQERNIINGTTTAVVAPLLDFYNSLIPFLLLAIVLIFVDSRFGVAAAKKRGEPIRTSRKWRRAINKLVDYICWVTLAGLFGQTFGTILGIPILSGLLLLIVYSIEISSCFNNYFEAKGINKKINVFKLFNRQEVERCIEDVPDKEKEVKKMKPIVILDNGHGEETAGKRSPVWGDGSQLFEWEFNRDIVRRIAAKLDDWGIGYEILTPETNDVSLAERCRRANEIYRNYNEKAFLVSIHANAGGGTGWEVYTSPGETKADAIATVFAEEAQRVFVPDGWRMRFDYADGDLDKEAAFYILKHTSCPAILTENFFMDTEKDCRFIMSEDGRERIANMHVAAIKRVLTL